MALTLGTKPETLKVLLSPRSDFMFTLRPKNGALWKAGVQLELVIGAQSWTVDTTPEAATWIIDQADVDAALAQADLTAEVWYIEPGATQQQEVRLIMARGVAVATYE